MGLIMGMLLRRMIEKGVYEVDVIPKAWPLSILAPLLMLARRNFMPLDFSLSLLEPRYERTF